MTWVFGMQHKEPRGPRAVCDLLLEKLSAAEAEVTQLVQDTGQSSGRDAQGHRSASSLRSACVHAHSLCICCFCQSSTLHRYTCSTFTLLPLLHEHETSIAIKVIHAAVPVATRVRLDIAALS